jgi:hypothetical protein
MRAMQVDHIRQGITGDRHGRPGTGGHVLVVDVDRRQAG